MAHYIDKDALVADIESLRKYYIDCDDYDNGWIFALDKILSLIDTIEVKEMQEEPVSIDFEHELYKAFGQVKDFTLGMRIAKWFYDMGKNNQEHVSEDLGEYISELSKQFQEVSFAKLSRIAVSVAKWQKSNILKHADGDDLPEIDREVIALEGIIDQTANDCFCGYKVVFAHRPTKEGYDGKSIATGVVEHYTPKTYGEGGWNIPNIVYWLDIELPKEIEL